MRGRIRLQRYRSFLVLCLTLAGGGLTVHGQSASGRADTGMDRARQPDTLCLQLLENLSGRIEVESCWYPHKPEPHPGLRDTDSVTVEGRLRLESWWSTGATRLDLAGWLEYGSLGDVRWAGGAARPRDLEDRSRPAGIERLVLSHQFGASEQWEVAAGKDLFRSSVAVIGTLADRHSIGYNAYELLDPINLGVWQLRLQHFGDNGQLTLAALPVFQPTKKPVLASRWYLGEAAAQELIPADVEIVVKDELPDVRFPELGWLLRYARQSARLDWFVLGYRGYSDYVTYELAEIRFAPGVVAVLEETYTPCWQMAAGVSTSRGAWEFHGEGLYHRPDGHRTDEFLNYVLGATVQCNRLAETALVEDISLTVEYVGEAELREAERQEPVTEFDPELSRIASAVLVQFLVRVNADFAVSLRSLHELDADNAHVSRIEVKRRLRDNLHLTVSGEVFDASDYRASGWNRNDRFQLQLTYSF